MLTYAPAQIAIELSGTVLHGCPIMVNYAPAGSSSPRVLGGMAVGGMRMDGVIGTERGLWRSLCVRAGTRGGACEARAGVGALCQTIYPPPCCAFV